MKPIHVVVLAALLGLQAQQASARDVNDLGPRPPGQFDFYALSLTWVPGFCSTHQDLSECGRGTGFALHGMWPESADGYPSFCSAEPLPAAARATYQGLYASPSLIDHEWQRHGTCSGLGAVGFLETTRSLLAEVAIPPELARAGSLGAADAGAVKRAFVSSNPGMDPESLVLVCDGSRIEEIHLCFDKDGSSRACAGWEHSEDNCL